MPNTSRSVPPRRSARVLLDRVTDHAARTLATQAGPVGGIISGMDAYARGGLALYVLEFRSGSREVYRANEVEVCVCACGCGQPVGLTTRTDASRGLIAGAPRRYVRGHNGRRVAFPGFPVEEPNPTGRCLCGCGSQTRRVGQTNFRAGYRKGWYARFCPGHDLSHRTPQTQCQLGHALTEGNVYVHQRHGQMRRDCRTCRRGREQRWRARRALAVQGRAAGG